MGKSIDFLIKQSIEKEEKKIKSEMNKTYKKESKRFLNAVVNQTAHEIYVETTKMYDAFIDYFYKSYSPTSYKRHSRKSGVNLYFAEQIKLTYSNGLPKSVIVNFDGSEMEEYKAQRKRSYVTTDYVLDLVMIGVRGLRKTDQNGVNRNNKSGHMTWLFSYSGKYYKTPKRMTPDAAFSNWVAKGDVYVGAISHKIISKEKKSKAYKYIKYVDFN